MGQFNFLKITLYKFIKFNMNYRYITLKGKNKKFFTIKNTNIRKILIRKLMEVIYDDEIIVFWMKLLLVKEINGLQHGGV